AIWVGDIFKLNASVLGKVDAIYDRAALVALPATMRADYTAHLIAITHAAPQLLITFEYDQSCIDGPPFSLTGHEVGTHYRQFYQVHKLFSSEVQGGLKGKVAADETVCLLTRSHA
ncbi:MAG: thiopurine S-methyltransferase, partial [Undibacterium sp.]|nr:thiopurine S-methyltransferase [Undibacterium sp.]